MFKFDKGDNVIVNTNTWHNGKTGIVVMFYPAGILNAETIYRIKHSDGNTGMFKESEIEFMEEK